jgi:hypothetical protein
MFMQNVICLHVTTALFLCPRQSSRLYALGLEGQIQCVYDRDKQLPREQVLNQQYDDGDIMASKLNMGHFPP